MHLKISLIKYLRKKRGKNISENRVKCSSSPTVISQTGFRVDKYTCASSLALRQLSFQPHKACGLAAAPRRERPPSPVSGTPASPTSPGWKERDHVSSLMLNTTVKVTLWHLFSPTARSRLINPYNPSADPEPLLPNNWIIEGNQLGGALGGRWEGRDGRRGKGRHVITAHTWPQSQLSQQPSLRRNSNPHI